VDKAEEGGAKMTLIKLHRKYTTNKGRGSDLSTKNLVKGAMGVQNVPKEERP